MSTSTQLEILDIRHFSARQLRPLLEAESAQWHNRLRWDYRSSTELLLKYLDSRVLPGFVALDRSHSYAAHRSASTSGEICGFSFCVYEGVKAVIGDAFAQPTAAASAVEITRLLLTHLLELIRHTPNITRIESQLLLNSVGDTEPIFAAAGFRIFPRLFMEQDLRRLDPVPQGTGLPSNLPSKLVLRRWSATHYQAVAEFIHLGYRGHLDSLINDQYRSLHGSLRFLHNIVRFPGCGVFAPEASWLLLDPVKNAIVGVVLCSQVVGPPASRVAHITQICLAPQLRGLGLGRILLAHTMQHLRRAGFEAITLTVTEENHPAVRLYREAGFTTRHRFHAMVSDSAVEADSPGGGSAAALLEA